MDRDITHSPDVEPEGSRAGLASPIFLSALLLLLVNDFLLKPAFHNLATGKISDVAGLFAFSVFWMALLPARRLQVAVVVAAAFLYWKSSHAQWLIDSWNELDLLHLGRTVDPTDYWALPAVALAYFHSGGIRPARVRRLVLAAVVPIALIAFTATSVVTTHRYERSYAFPFSVGELDDRLNTLGYRHRTVAPIGILPPQEIEMHVPADVCGIGVNATLRLEEAPGGSVLRLIEINQIGCLKGSREKQKLLEIFEESVIDKLGQNR